MAKKYTTENSSVYHRSPDGSVEVRDFQKVVRIETTQDPFYMTFLNYVGWMYDIRGNVALNVMARLMEIAEYNTGIVSLTPAARKRIMADVGIQPSALSRALNLLVEKGALRNSTIVDKKTGEVIKASGEYQVNPEMFWKGELAKRNKLVVAFRAGYIDDDNTQNDFGIDFGQNSTATNEF